MEMEVEMKEQEELPSSSSLGCSGCPMSRGGQATDTHLHQHDGRFTTQACDSAQSAQSPFPASALDADLCGVRVCVCVYDRSSPILCLVS